ncbi:hypothetical protein D922_00612 [Enterococcus faecalis 06-MB-DW-09]|nr:hypothetical protein D922_00612 [Enterococcus faecalis 06-MB-DW-09]
MQIQREKMLVSPQAAGKNESSPVFVLSAFLTKGAHHFYIKRKRVKEHGR